MSLGYLARCLLLSYQPRYPASQRCAVLGRSVGWSHKENENCLNSWFALCRQLLNSAVSLKNPTPVAAMWVEGVALAAVWLGNCRCQVYIWEDLLTWRGLRRLETLDTGDGDGGWGRDAGLERCRGSRWLSLELLFVQREKLPRSAAEWWAQGGTVRWGGHLWSLDSGDEPITRLRPVTTATSLPVAE